MRFYIGVEKIYFFSDRPAELIDWTLVLYGTVEDPLKSEREALLQPSTASPPSIADVADILKLVGYLKPSSWVNTIKNVSLFHLLKCYLRN